MVKESAYIAGDLGLIPTDRMGYPLLFFEKSSEKCHDKVEPGGLYSPWGHSMSQMANRATNSFTFHVGVRKRVEATSTAIRAWKF